MPTRVPFGPGLTSLLSVLSFFSLAASAACSAQAPVVDSRTGQDEAPPESTGGDARPSGTADAATPLGSPTRGDAGAGAGEGEGEGAAEAGAGEAGPGDVDAAVASGCMARCEANLRAKCAGDATFCIGVCKGILDTELACLEAAPDCSKATWASCVSAGDPGDGGKK